MAVEYAYRHLGDVGVAWQFAAEDATVLAPGFGRLAAQLGAQGLGDTRDPVASVHAVLAKFPAPWLLIFDNAIEIASLAAFLPPAGPGRVLITSQNQNWPHGQALQVPLLDTKVAADFLVSRTGDPDPQMALNLAGELDGLPLALEQAAAYTLATGGTLAGYLSLFQQRRADILARGEPTGYRGTVATTWLLAFDQIEQSSPAAVGLLRLLACCAPQAVPLRLLLHPRSWPPGKFGPDVAPALRPLLEDPLAAPDAVAALRRYSLISSAADGSVSVHRLVQAVTLDQISAELAVEYQQAAAAVIEAAIPHDPRLPQSWPLFESLLPHAEAALAADSNGMVRIASYLAESGNCTAARDLQQRVVSARERVLGPNHRSTLGARAYLAHFTGKAGDAATARDQHAALLPATERLFGPEHPTTLITRGNLARWVGDTEDAAAARDQYAALLPATERVFGPEHPNTLNTRSNLAGFTGEAGDAAGARDQYAALLPVRKRVLGPEHPDVLATRDNLAAWTGRAGDAATARDQYAALLPAAERMLGPEHPDTLGIRASLARWTWETGDAAGARDLDAALLPAAERVLGPEHPDVLATRSRLAGFTGEAGDAAGARDQFAELLPLAERVLGPEHPEVLHTRANLARWTEKARAVDHPYPD